jgi:hypothetical protein
MLPLLHHLGYQLQRAEHLVVYLDGRRWDGVDEMADELRRRLGVKSPTRISFEALAALSGTEPEPKAPSAQRTLDALLGAMPASKRWVVLLDSPQHDAAHTLFGRLRDVVWQLPISWVVTADSSAADAFRRPPADAFFDPVERLSTLDEDTGRQVLVRRGLVASAADDLVTSTAMTPRVLLDRARRSMLEHVTPDEVHSRELDFQGRLGELGGAAAMLARELRGNGAVSASDQDLQRRMGWTRSRLTQVLKELEAAGLVTATEAAEGRAGRPRRRYEVVAP